MTKNKFTDIDSAPIKHIKYESFLYDIGLTETLRMQSHQAYRREIESEMAEHQKNIDLIKQHFTNLIQKL